MKKILLFLSIVFVLNACTVHLVPQKSQTIIDMVNTSANNTNALYDHVISSGDKYYGNYANEYANIDSEISEIITLDSARTKPKIILGMMHDVQNRFSNYEADHKARILNNSELQVYKDEMHAIWSTIINAENNYK